MCIRDSTLESVAQNLRQVVTRDELRQAADAEHLEHHRTSLGAPPVHKIGGFGSAALS